MRKATTSVSGSRSERALSGQEISSRPRMNFFRTGTAMLEPACCTSASTRCFSSSSVMPGSTRTV